MPTSVTTMRIWLSHAWASVARRCSTEVEIKTRKFSPCGSGFSRTVSDIRLKSNPQEEAATYGSGFSRTTFRFHSSAVLGGCFWLLSLLLLSFATAQSHAEERAMQAQV